MEAKAVFICLFICVSFCGVFAQVGSICRPNERLLSCGCPKTCRDPVPNCKGVCKTGCFCEEGEVRNENGNCVKLAECPPLLLPYKQETSEPRLHGSDCPEDEEYKFCEPCNRSCEHPNPICPAQCAKGCFCKGDLLRDKDGRCVKFEECSNFADYIREREKGKNLIQPIPYRYSCGNNQQYKECQKCTQSCTDPEPVCGRCKTGCFCKDGFVKGPDGKCVKREECPKVSTKLLPREVTVSTAEFFFSSIEECSSGEEYLSCGWCEPTCQDPSPACPAACTRGCLCRPPMLRHADGRCVTENQCGTQKCSDPNEVYSCLRECEPRCNTAPCPNSRPARRCAFGCHCRLGLLRDASNKCVNEDQCFNNKTVIIVE